MDKFSRWLDARMSAQDMSNAELADLIGRSTSYISRIRSGERLGHDVRPDICDALGSSLAEFEAETAGDAYEAPQSDVERAISNDPALTEDMRAALLAMYRMAVRDR